MSWAELFNSSLSAPFAQLGGSFWLPERAARTAYGVDWVFYGIYYLALFFFVGILLAMIFFVWKYHRRQEGEKAQGRASHHTALEITWTIIPLILVIVIFYFGFKGMLNLYTAPTNAYEVKVVGQRWKWLFEYPNGYVDENLHVPVNQPVRLLLRSEDVIHSLFIPAFRIKRDVVPGRYTTAWFEATQPGDYQIFCAEYCGQQHSDMLASCIVHEPGMFEKWLADASNFLAKMPPHEAGKMLFNSRGCKQCHAVVEGEGGKGPTLYLIFGHEVEMEDGTRITVDENYLRQSIEDPQAQVVAGFQPIMPTYKGRLKDEEIDAVVAYLKSLDPNFVPPPWTPPDPNAAGAEASSEVKNATGNSAP